MKISTPSEIYKKVEHEIGSIIEAFKSNHYNEMDQEALKQTIPQLEKMKSKLNLELEILNKNAEWDVFNIAFYGETNAGKSTLIETLRILLEEPTKVCERESFDHKKHEIIGIEEKIDSHNNLFKEVKEKYNLEVKSLNEKVDLLKEDTRQIHKIIACLKKEKMDMENVISTKKKSSLISFFLYLMGILSEQQILWDLNYSIQSNSSTLNQFVSQSEELDIEMNTTSDKMSFELEKTEDIGSKLKETHHQFKCELLNLSDGAIIGDGQSDFTRDVISYKFSRGNQDFTLLDLPGIEGKEDLVMNEIDSAVQKAHVVFYITNKAAPPQNGTDNYDGTLQKIKKHLGQHTEVYSIYNKRVKNHQQLIPGLVNDDEKKSLLGLEAVMKEHLGDHYSKNIVLTAYPAFLSLGKNSHDTFLKAQGKFLKKYIHHNKLLSESNVDKFANWLVGDIVNECKTKIIKSNYHKVNVRLSDTETSLRTIHNELKDVKKILEKTRQGTVNQLDEAVNILMKNLQNTIRKEINDFVRNFRTEIYKEIEKEINGKIFKEKYKILLEEYLLELEGELNKSIDSVLEAYKEDIESIIEKYNRYESELLDVYNKHTSLNHDIIDNLKLKGLVNLKKAIREVVLVLMGLITGLLTPAGWLSIAFSIVGAIVSISKNLINFFDKNKRITYQKSVVNKSIDKTSTDILDSINKSIDKSNDELVECTEKIKKDIRKPTKNIDSMIYILKIAEEKIGIIQSTITREGVS